MKSSGRDAPQTAAMARQHLGAIDALVLAALLALALLLMVRSGSRRGVELMPWPDGLEYAASAVNIDRGLGPVLHFGSYSYPSRYTEGYPLILAIAWPLTASDPARLYFATIAMGLLAIAAIYALTFRMFGRLSAALATSMLALSPVVLSYSTLVLSDVPAMAVTILAGLALASASDIESRPAARDSLAQAWAMVGILAGFAAMIRPTNAAMLAGLVLCLAMVRPAGLGLKLRHLFGAIAAFAIGFAIFPLWQMHTNVSILGSASASGYGWWVPEVYGSMGKTFSASYLFGPTMPRNPHGNVIVYVLTLLGLDGMMGDRGDPRFFLYPFAAAAFAAIGIGATIRDLGMRTAKRVMWFGLGFLVALLAVYSVYLFTDIAFLLPGAFVLFATAGFGIVAGNRWARGVLRNRERDGRSLAGAVGVIVLDVLLAISLMSVIASRLNANPTDSTMAPALEALDSTVPQNATVISNISMQFLELYLPGRQVLGLNTADPGERFTDYHLHRLFEKRTGGWDGALPAVVFDGADITKTAMFLLVAANRAKTPVFVLLCAPESEQYAAMLKTELDELQARFTIEPVEQNSAIALYRLSAKGGNAARSQPNR
ncbi:MAG: glycosyltransferase family 39 protein [Candidatus Binatus sp.]|uniref:ArnT family glycosyltransferase n=1 Tax=Candidatus Binatus sp. TaxID=2811406 RepID=UPI00271A152E|nr:glycosyltransferase family 39 protein [Candidatus Binatus sp.]MDO8434683.1 glycosyltransferase family 39 protein [Candidatus Binatus sp.]